MGLLDTGGRTLYWFAFRAFHARHHVALAASIGAAFGALGSIATLAQRLSARLPAKPDAERPGWLVGAAARLVAILVLSIFLIATATLAAAIVCDFGEPLGRTLPRSAQETPANWVPMAVGVAVALLMSLFFAFARVFINRSSQNALYSARITRAYLGGSNPLRWAQGPVGAGKMRDFISEEQGLPDRSAATRVMPDDDIVPEVYWRWPPSGEAGSGSIPADPYSRGAPIHLINVTINETVDGRSQIQQADRKGVGMALGPCGISVGVRRHAIFKWDDRKYEPHFVEDGHLVLQRDSPKLAEMREASLETLGSKSFPKERLTIGEWLGISGAAFSTGLGFRTNFGLSILAGMANIRLGYWWKPGVVRPHTIKRALGALFWVQSYLLRELLARFPGTANALWYLTDGGHFENLGAYELIRRRVEFILIVDAEADEDYRFQGLGNLVRKARLDFGAEIEFLPNEDKQKEGGPRKALADFIHLSVLERFGTLNQLRRGRWVKGLVRTPPPDIVADKGWELHSSQRSDLSLANAALAKVTYADDPTKLCWLMYVKPTLTGKEPADVLRYHSEHPDFPHETTANQFFDEDQWESYRKLGDHIGAELFDWKGQGEQTGGIHPRDFFTGEHLGYASTVQPAKEGQRKAGHPSEVALHP